MAAVHAVQFGQTTDQAAGSRAPYRIFAERFKLTFKRDVSKLGRCAAWVWRHDMEMSRGLEGDVSRAAFRRLLQTGAPAPVSDLARDLGQPADEIGAAVEGLSNQGRIRVDREGRVVGAAGLSIGPDRHQIDIGAHTFWTWCAYDVLGIFGALRASGAARSASPHSGESLEVYFRHGRPEPTTLVVFRPDDDFMRCCANVYEEWCANSNFFESQEAASAWSKAHGLNGHVLSLTEAAELATPHWEPLAAGLLS